MIILLFNIYEREYQFDHIAISFICSGHITIKKDISLSFVHARLCLFSTMILTNARLTLTVFVLVFVCCHSFDVPEAKFEVFRPKGFKVSIPGEKILIKRNKIMAK